MRGLLLSPLVTFPNTKFDSLNFLTIPGVNSVVNDGNVSCCQLTYGKIPTCNAMRRNRSVDCVPRMMLQVHVFRVRNTKGEEHEHTSSNSSCRHLQACYGLSIGLAVLMIVLGFAAMFKPFAAGLGISLFIAWIIVFSGVAHIIYAFAARSAGSFLWRTLIGVVYLVGGMLSAEESLDCTGIFHADAGCNSDRGRRVSTNHILSSSRPAWFRLDSL